MTRTIATGRNVPNSYQSKVMRRLASIPIAYWPHDEPAGSSTIRDIANGHTLTLANGVLPGVRGADAQSLAAWYSFSTLTNTFSYTDILAAWPGFASALNTVKGSLMIWHMIPAHVSYYGAPSVIANTTLTDASLIGAGLKVPTQLLPAGSGSSTATGGSTTTLIDSGANFTGMTGKILYILDGSSASVSASTIQSLTGTTQLNFAVRSNAVDNTSVYTIFDTDLAPWIIQPYIGTGSAAATNVNRPVLKFNNATGLITTTRWSTNPDANTVYRMWNAYACGWAKQSTGGKSLYVVGGSANGLINQLEVQTDRMTLNDQANNVEQQAFQAMQFRGVPPAWNCMISTWDQTAGGSGEFYAYNNGIRFDTGGGQPSQPIAGLVPWTQAPDTALIGCQAIGGTWLTGKGWIGPISDIAFWDGVVASQADATALAVR